MRGLKRFSAVGYSYVVENRDCLFDPYEEQRSSYLREEDLSVPFVDLSGMIHEDITQYDICKECFKGEKLTT